MTLIRIEAHLECDGCGQHYTAEIDPANNLASYIDLSAFVEHHLVDVIGDHQLCPQCSVIVATTLEEVEDPTYDQVQAALNTGENIQVREGATVSKKKLSKLLRARRE